MARRPPEDPVQKPEFRPERFAGLTPTAKLVWYHVRDHPGEWSKYTLAAALGMPNSDRTVFYALKELVERGLLEVTRAAEGSRAASYRARGG